MAASTGSALFTWCVSVVLAGGKGPMTMRGRRNRRDREIREVREIRASPAHQTAKFLLSVLMLVWFGAGLVAAMQRDYFTNTPANCGDLGTIGLTVLAGPLNYLGLNPKVSECQLPEPSR
ncbi:hypothetical protein ACIO14_19775 [Nocardia fluminea]|uniref:hypothetical protein n=1 Tax=Nocardia fluminea TaxID=134984 RepID=UPI0037F1951B